uniref:Uncharacterized protein n=1 Tax=Anguilla anguilla TaxID=7936 RepID=A0A0E9V8M1_ANGAN
MFIFILLVSKNKSLNIPRF